MMRIPFGFKMFRYNFRNSIWLFKVCGPSSIIISNFRSRVSTKSLEYASAYIGWIDWGFNQSLLTGFLSVTARSELLSIPKIVPDEKYLCHQYNDAPCRKPISRRSIGSFCLPLNIFWYAKVIIFNNFHQVHYAFLSIIILINNRLGWEIANSKRLHRPVSHFFHTHN